MLKSANEAVQATQAARQAAEDEERDRKAGAAQQRRHKAELDQRHQEFEALAHEAALEGAVHIVVPGNKLNLERLHRQGLVARQLTRRITFQSHLEQLTSEKLVELTTLCDRVVRECEGLHKIDGDEFLHRNPLMSLMETLWRKGDLRMPIDIELFLAFIRTLTGAQPVWLEANKALLLSVLKRFEGLKSIKSKHHSVCWENLMISQGEQSATFISWEGSEDGGGLIAEFSAQKLRWLASHWPDVSTYLSSKIEEDSHGGLFESSFFIRFSGHSWLADTAWPIGSEETDIEFCNPSIVVCELDKAGYQSNLECFIDHGATLDEGADSNGKDERSDDGVIDYRLIVSWGAT